jgi:hypothetical protein
MLWGHANRSFSIYLGWGIFGFSAHHNSRFVFVFDILHMLFFFLIAETSVCNEVTWGGNRASVSLAGDVCRLGSLRLRNGSALAREPAMSSGRVSEGFGWKKNVFGHWNSSSPLPGEGSVRTPQIQALRQNTKNTV